MAAAAASAAECHDPRARTDERKRSQPQVRWLDAQLHQAWVLLLMLMPQLLDGGVVAAAAAAGAAAASAAPLALMACVLPVLHWDLLLLLLLKLQAVHVSLGMAKAGSQHRRAEEPRRERGLDMRQAHARHVRSPECR